MTAPLVDADPPIRVAVMASKSDTRLQYLVEDDSNRGVTYELVGGFVNDTESAAIPLLQEAGVPHEVRDLGAFYDERDAAVGDMDVREEFDAGSVEIVAEFDPDLVVLAGYLHILTAPLVDRFFPRLINAHHADLTVRNASGDPIYTGLRTAEDAIRNGEPRTYETTHLVIEAVDKGPIIARSPPFEVHRELVEDAVEAGADDVLDAYVYAHRGWMIREGGGPTLAKTIKLIADGRITFDGREISIDGTPGYYQLDDGIVTRRS